MKANKKALQDKAMRIITGQPQHPRYSAVRQADEDKRKDKRMMNHNINIARFHPVKKQKKHRTANYIKREQQIAQGLRKSI